MNIALLNKKGGVGKTTFGFSIAKDLGCYMQSNDYSIIEQIYPGKAKISKNMELVDADCVYDFGGFVASGVLDIIKHCDYIIVPILPSLNAIFKAVETIKEIYAYNKNIIILATGFKDDKEKEFLRVNLEATKINPVAVYYFKFSKILNNSINAGMSFLELYDENPLARRGYEVFISEYKKLLARLKEKH